MSRKHRLLPDGRGKIKEILMVTPKALKREEWKEVFKSKYSQFDSDVDVVLCSRFLPDKNKSNSFKTDFQLIANALDGAWAEAYQMRLDKELGFLPREQRPKDENGYLIFSPTDFPTKKWAPIEVSFCKLYSNLPSPMRSMKGCKESDFGLDQYAQDPFLVMEGGDGDPVFVEPWYFSNFGNQHIAEVVAERMGYYVQPTRFVFEGGNVLVGNDEILIGEDTFQENWKNYQELGHGTYPDQKSFRQYLEKVLKSNLNLSEIHWVGLPQLRKLDARLMDSEKTTFQPFFHLDLFMTYVGKIEIDGKVEKVILLADLKPRYVFWSNHYLNNGGVEDFELLEGFVDALDIIRKDLKRKGFKVIDIPIGMDIQWSGDKIGWRAFSYNNCLMEIYTSHYPIEQTSTISRIYVPDYSISFATYKNGRSIFRRLKRMLECELYKIFDVIRYPKFQFDPNQRGALHCVMKVLRRE